MNLQNSYTAQYCNGIEKPEEEKECNKCELVKLHEVPSHLQFNPYVLTGYRPMMSFWNCIYSLTYFHNETINIVSHVVPLLYAIWIMPDLLPWGQIGIPILPYLHGAAIVAPWFGSSMYHLFMNHHSGSQTYCRLLQWDVIGVWVTQTGGGIITIYIGTYCLPMILRVLILGVYLWFASDSLYQAVVADSAWARRKSFAYLFLIRMVVLALRMTSYGGGSPKSIPHIILQDLLPLVGAVVSATLIPERWLRGQLDLAFNSHNVMHVLVVLGGVHMHWAVEYDFDWLLKSPCP